MTSKTQESVDEIGPYTRSPDDKYLGKPKPSWYLEHTHRRPAELHLDLNKIYSAAEYWQDDLTDKDPGMPIEHRNWALHLVDNFVPSLTSINFEKCNFGDVGLIDLALVMRTNTALRSINLKDSNISSRQAGLFLDTIESYNFTLTTLDLDEGKKSAFQKNKMQYQSLTVIAVAGEIMGSESEVSEFLAIKKRATRITAFNSRVCKVIDGQSDKLELIMHDSKGTLDGNARSAPGGTRARELRGDRMGLMFKMMPNLKSLTIDRWYPMSVATGDRKWFDDLPSDEQNARLVFDTKIPPELWALPNLEELRFYDCYDPNNPTVTFFRSVPQEVTKMAKLKHLVISRCGMETVEEPLDQGIVPGKFTSENLERSVLYRLTSLQTLGLPGNLLKRIPETIGYCTSLTRLSIGSNKLEYLPDALLLLSNLRELWATDNYIWRVPVSLPKYCPKLEDLRILQQGEDEKKSSLIPGDEKELRALRDAEKAAPSSKRNFSNVIDYMRTFLNERKTIRLNRYKLVVVGDGAVGKTTTIRSLQQHAASSYKRKKNENILDNVATDGIAIQMLRLPANAKRTPGYIGGNECLNFSCWDFAGQDVYTYSHTFFMTEKSIYLIGFDCKLGDSSAGIERVDYWLQVVRSRFPNAYCVVFGTHIDEVGKEDFKTLQKTITARYKSKGGASSAVSTPTSSKSKTSSTKAKNSKMSAASPTATLLNKRDMFKVSAVEFISNATGKGLPELIADIKKFPTYLEKTKRIKKSEEEIPMNWLVLEERGKAKGATRLVPIIQWSEWQQLARTELNMDETQLREATSHWHETGSLSWFDEDGLRDIVCLRPDFLTDVFSAVISAKTGLSSGILRHDALIQIWKGLPLYLYPHLLTILEKFEILHKLEGGVLEGEGGDLFGSGTTAHLLTAHDYLAATSPELLSPPTTRLAAVNAPPQSGIVQSGGVTLDFGAPQKPASAVPSSSATVTNADDTQGAANVVSALTSQQIQRAKNLFTGRSIIPAMLPEQEPPASELEKQWPELPRGGAELVRLYTFEFVPNGFFARLLVRLLHSKWRASLWWRWGIILSKNMARLFLKYDGRTRTMSLRVRGPNNVAKVGSLIDSISTLIQDWIQQSEILITIPYTYPDGTEYVFQWSEVEKVAQSGQMMVQPSENAQLPPVRIDNLAPDLALLTTSAKVFSEQELNIGKQLGRGGFAIVLKGTLPTGEPVACKKLIFDKSQEESGETTFSDVFTEFRREVWLMSGLQHPNLVQLLGVCTQPNLMMVLEFMEGGTLYDYVHGTEESPKQNLSLEEKFSLALEVARGMQFMHGLNPPIIHRDLKSPNILMTYRGSHGQKMARPTAKIADFGLSRGLQWTTSMSDKAVDNPVWLAPEVMMRKPYNEKADVYSYGVILYEIVMQLRFMEEIAFDYQKENAVKQGTRPVIPLEVDPVLSSLISFCWAQDPNNRPSFDQIVECLETKTIIKSARPSKLNYGTGFEDFDDPESDHSQFASGGNTAFSPPTMHMSLSKPALGSPAASRTATPPPQALGAQPSPIMPPPRPNLPPIDKSPSRSNLNSEMASVSVGSPNGGPPAVPPKPAQLSSASSSSQLAASPASLKKAPLRTPGWSVAVPRAESQPHHTYLTEGRTYPVPPQPPPRPPQ